MGIEIIILFFFYTNKVAVSAFAASRRQLGRKKLDNSR